MEGFSYKITKKDNCGIVFLKGNIDTTTAKDFRSLLVQTLEQNIFFLILNYKDINYVSSSGWGILLSHSRRFKEKNGMLIVCEMNRNVKHIFDIMEIKRFVEYRNSLQDALQLFPVPIDLNEIEFVAVEKIPEKSEVRKKFFDENKVRTILRELAVENPFLSEDDILRELEKKGISIPEEELYRILIRENIETKEKRLVFAYKELRKMLRKEK